MTPVNNEKHEKPWDLKLTMTLCTAYWSVASNSQIKTVLVTT